MVSSIISFLHVIDLEVTGVFLGVTISNLRVTIRF